MLSRFALCSLDLHVLRVQKIIGFLILITHKSTRLKNPKTWQSQVKSLRQMMLFMYLVVVLIGQFCRDVIGRQVAAIGWLLSHRSENSSFDSEDDYRSGSWNVRKITQMSTCTVLSNEAEKSSLLADGTKSVTVPKWPTNALTCWQDVTS